MHEHAEDQDEYFDAQHENDFEEAPVNMEVNFDEMARNYFACVDEIHEHSSEEEDSVLDFSDLSAEEDEPNQSDLLEDLLREAAEPLYGGSSSSRLQFSIILMSLCTLYSVSHHCLDEILTFLKHDLLPPDNCCPKNSYEMKTLLMKLGLSHESIHYCDCGRTLYWKENSQLDRCPKCGKSRYIEGSKSVLNRVLRYFSLIKRLRRMFRCPELSKHLRWHSTNHSALLWTVSNGDSWRTIFQVLVERKGIFGWVFHLMV